MVPLYTCVTIVTTYKSTFQGILAQFVNVNCGQSGDGMQSVNFSS